VHLIILARSGRAKQNIVVTSVHGVVEVHVHRAAATIIVDVPVIAEITGNQDGPIPAPLKGSITTTATNARMDYHFIKGRLK
jgi:hypothetical protein